ncbi:hypothetical protein TWF481_001378 [Arthrobotrys musiformis]|uniref:Mitochondrial division protein 1 n=1 Tax=Arthrobotrys musiformis TaxID=47236 RepID=A0AAV9WR96_9PEZI
MISIRLAELNNIEGVIKGLILRLVDQHVYLKENLRKRWDMENERFYDTLSTWRQLWDVFLEILERCESQRVYIIIDALDECQDGEIEDLLISLIRTGLSNPKIKWFLTSRPLSAERLLEPGPDQSLLSLDSSLDSVSRAVKAYITSKTKELDRRHSYGETLRLALEAQLIAGAEDTYLWVNLVCKRLETVPKDETLSTIQEFPAGLDKFYERILSQLTNGDPNVARDCVKILRVVMLAYRPLKVAEIESVARVANPHELVDRCASLLKVQGGTIEFVHKSAQDYVSKAEQLGSGSYDGHSHGEIALNCLSWLTEKLKPNLADLPQPSFTWTTLGEAGNETNFTSNPRRVKADTVAFGLRDKVKENLLVTSLNYAASFWAKRLEAAQLTTEIENSLTEHGLLDTFLKTKFLEWLECLSLLNELSHATDALNSLSKSKILENNRANPLPLRDAVRFLSRHYQTIAARPLQAYVSAIAFSPQHSSIRRYNSEKLPKWLKELSQMEKTWPPLIHTLDNKAPVSDVAFSPNGEKMASVSTSFWDRMIKVWDPATGALLKVLLTDQCILSRVAISRDGKDIAAASSEMVIIWDAETGNIKHEFTVPRSRAHALAFLSDGSQLVSASWRYDGFITINSWNINEGRDYQHYQEIHRKHSHIDAGSKEAPTIAISSDGKVIISGPGDINIELWNVTGDLQKEFIGHSGKVTCIICAPDNTRILSGDKDGIIRIWDIETGRLERVLNHDGGAPIVAIAVSQGGEIVSASSGRFGTLKVWNATGEIQKTFKSRQNGTDCVAFSPDCEHIVSGGSDNVKLWSVADDFQGENGEELDDIASLDFSPASGKIVLGSSRGVISLWDIPGTFQAAFKAHLESISCVVFSPDSKLIASGAGSGGGSIKLWTITGDLEKAILGNLYAPVRWIAFSPDGTKIVSTYETSIKVWNITGELYRTIEVSGGWVTRGVFSPDEKYFVLRYGAPADVMLWDSSELLADRGYIRTRVSRFFKPSARRKFGLRYYLDLEVLGVSEDSKHVITNYCLLQIDTRDGEHQVMGYEHLKQFRVEDSRIYYGAVPVLHLPREILSLKVINVIKGNHIVFALSSGRPLYLNIDRENLASTLKA